MYEEKQGEEKQGEEKRLVERIAADLDAGFPAIVTTYGGAVYSTALRLSLQPADAEDLAAETFVRAYAALAGYPPARILALQPRAWLVTITLNLWRNQCRDAGRRPTLVSLDPATVPTSRTPDGDPDGPEEAAVRRELSERAGRLLGGLPETQRVPVVLRHIVGLTYREISTVLECPMGTVKSHVSRGVVALRVALDAGEKEGP